MKFSEQWVREWLELNIDRDTLAAQLTMAGLEVDAISPVAAAFNKVVVGQVVACAPHPDADKLRVTRVDIGQDEPLAIVCGAANCRLGLKVAVATVGAELPGGLLIREAKLRGEPSFGMLCSAKELGLSEEAEGLLELPEDAPVGLDVRQYLKLDDASIEIGLTPNRADCLGMLGIARELAVINNVALLDQQQPALAATIAEQRQVRLLAAEACPRYLGRVIRNINPQAATPLWMKEKLRRCGLRSIDAVVDVTNFVLLELGQPLHAFDLARLEGDIEVRMARAGEQLTLLDGQTVSLDDSTLVIADERKALAMAGIFGGADSGVSGETRHIFLESAFFSPAAIAGRARRYGLKTDASHRYERGVDPELQRRAIERATELLLAIVGGEPGPVVEALSAGHLPQRQPIMLRHARLTRLLGHEISAERVEAILRRLGMQLEVVADGWRCLPPSFRFDIAIEEDLIEEVARIYGYNSIPNQSPRGALAMLAQDESLLPLGRARALLVDRDYQEAITYSFVHPAEQQLLHPGVEALILPHPISLEMSAMRLSLWPGLLAAVRHNQNRQQGRVRLFESGLRYWPQADGEIEQRPMLAGVICGLAAPEQWAQAKRHVDFFDLKADVEALLALTGESDSYRFVAISDDPALHPGQAARIERNGEPLGRIGALHPQLVSALDLNGPLFLFELDWQLLGQRRLPQARELSRFPANRRDIAVVVAEDVSATAILDVARKFGGNQLVGIDFFDLYQGRGVASGHKSLALSLTLQNLQRTLADDEIQAVVTAIVEGLKLELQATLRE